jgi:hypothetical protein
MKRPWPMWWAIMLLCFLGAVRVAALACAPIPLAYDPSFRMAPERSAVWGPSYTEFFFGFVSDYSRPVAASGHIFLALGVEALLIFWFLYCAYTAWSGREKGMVLGFCGGLLSVIALGSFAGFMWVILELFPTLMVGLGMSSGRSSSDDAGAGSTP